MLARFPTALPLLFAALLTGPAHAVDHSVLDEVGSEFVRLGLELGEYDPSYIDSYVGPEQLQAEAKAELRSRQALAEATARLLQRLENLGPFEGEQAQRHRSLLGKARALDTRARMLNGARFSFAEEAQLILDVAVPRYELSQFDELLAEIDSLLPGEGQLNDRVIELRQSVEIPAEKLDAVLRRAIDACRERTLAFISLPEDERFQLEYVTGVSWGGYLEYLGDHESRMSINTDQPVTIDRAVDLGCHEGYPGHHVYNLLVDRRYLQELAWVEFQLQPLYAPAMLIHEGSAEYGVELAFTPDESLAFQREVLAPMAGIDPDDVSLWDRVSRVTSRLGDYATTAISQRYLDGEITREQAIELFQKYLLQTRERAERAVRFAEDGRSYVLNYSLGEELVAGYVDSHAGRDEAARWRAFQQLIYELPAPSELQAQASR